jgi:ribonuclease HI
MMIEVYIDGSSKGNPGPGGAGIVIQDKATQETLGIHGIPLGAYSDEIGTDSEANRHAVRANRQSEESERSDAGILFIT